MRTRFPRASEGKELVHSRSQIKKTLLEKWKVGGSSRVSHTVKVLGSVTKSKLLS